MEETATQEHFEEHHNNHIVLTSEAQYFLNESAGWAKFLAILGFIGCGFTIIFGLLFGTIMNYLSRFSPAPQPTAAGFVGVFYFFYALLYFFPSYYLFTYGVKAKRALQWEGAEGLTVAIKNLKSCFKFWGILLIILMSLGLLIFIAVLLGVGIGAMNR